jgi:transcriptional regulator with XRE-family HTH domain
MTIAELRHTFATRIKELRAERGLNQGEFADFVGVSRGAMSYYEQEARTPDIGVLRMICERCGVSADYLTGLIPDRSRETSDVCLETGLYPKTVRKLRLIKEIQAIQSKDIFQTIGDTFDDPEEAMELTPYTAATAMINTLMCADGGLDVLALMSAIVFGGELVSDGAEVANPAVRLPRAHNYLAVDYKIKDLTAALWINVQENVAQIRDSLRAHEAMKPYYDHQADANEKPSKQYTCYISQTISFTITLSAQPPALRSSQIASVSRRCGNSCSVMTSLLYSKGQCSLRNALRLRPERPIGGAFGGSDNTMFGRR